MQPFLPLVAAGRAAADGVGGRLAHHRSTALATALGPRQEQLRVNRPGYFGGARPYEALIQRSGACERCRRRRFCLVAQARSPAGSALSTLRLPAAQRYWHRSWPESARETPVMRESSYGLLRESMPRATGCTDRSSVRYPSYEVRSEQGMRATVGAVSGAPTASRARDSRPLGLISCSMQRRQTATACTARRARCPDCVGLPPKGARPGKSSCSNTVATGSMVITRETTVRARVALSVT